MGVLTNDPNLLAAILAMDSYNRGYDAGIIDPALSNAQFTQIANVWVQSDLESKRVGSVERGEAHRFVNDEMPRWVSFIQPSSGLLHHHLPVQLPR